VQIPTHLPHAAIDLAEAKPGPGLALGRVERLQHPARDFGRHTLAIVGYPDANIVAERQHGPAEACALTEASAFGEVGGRDTQLTALRHGVPRVDDQVEQRPVELCPIEPAWPDLRRQPQLQSDAGPGSALHERLQSVEELVDVDDLEVEFLLARESKELRGQGGAALHRRVDLIQNWRQGGIRHAPPEQAPAARDDREQVTEVVHDSGGHLTHRVQPLSLGEVLPYRGTLALVLDQENDGCRAQKGNPERAPRRYQGTLLPVRKHRLLVESDSHEQGRALDRAVGEDARRTADHALGLQAPGRHRLQLAPERL